MDKKLNINEYIEKIIQTVILILKKCTCVSQLGI